MSKGKAAEEDKKKAPKAKAADKRASKSKEETATKTKKVEKPKAVKEEKAATASKKDPSTKGASATSKSEVSTASAKPGKSEVKGAAATSDTPKVQEPASGTAKEPKDAKSAEDAPGASGSKAAESPAEAESSSAKSSSAESPDSTPATPLPDPVGLQELEGMTLPAHYGKTGVFGGPKDHSIKPEDKLALPTGLHFQYEKFRTLNPKSFYCAMRWDYRQASKGTEEGKRWWANKKLVVTNPVNGKAVVVKAVDYGPHELSGLDILISPAAADVLQIEPGNAVAIAFADQGAKLGPVE